MYILIAFIGYLALAVVALLDKFIVSEEKLPALIVVFYSTAPTLPILLLVPFGAAPLVGLHDWSIAFVSGAAFTGALWSMYKGFEKTEVSHGGPLIGAVIPFFTLFLGYFFIAERVTTLQMVATGILIIGSLIISYEQTQKARGWNKNMLWLVVAGLCFAVSNVAAKYMYDAYGFFSGFVWTRAALGVSGLFLLASPLVRASVANIGKPSNKGIDTIPGDRRKKIITVVADKGLGFVGALFVQYAVAIGTVTIVNALAGLQYALLIIIVALLTRFVPTFFKEDYAKGEFVQEGLAVIIIGIGVALLLV